MTTTTSSPGAPAADPGATRGALVPLLFGFFPTQVLRVAATLGIADHLAAGPRTVADLAAATGTDEAPRPDPVGEARAQHCVALAGQSGR